jgi:enterobactin synthetase component D
MSFAPIFRLELLYGRCVGVSLPTGGRAGAPGADTTVPEAALAALHPDERRHAEGLGPVRRISWIGGRLGLRGALDDIPARVAEPILATPRGAPRLPAEVVGSISHKEGLAVGLAARAAGGWRIGIDLERLTARRSDIARRVLRPEERARLPPPSEPRRALEILAAFSAKEAIYKALDPFVGRYVAFDEVAVDLRDDGSAEVALHLRRPPGQAGEGPFEVQLGWLRRDDVIICTARARLAP